MAETKKMTGKEAKNIVSRDSYGLEGLPTEREFYFAKAFLEALDCMRPIIEKLEKIAESRPGNSKGTAIFRRQTAEEALSLWKKIEKGEDK